MHHIYSIIKPKHKGKWIAFTKDYRKILGYSESIITLRNRFKNNAFYTKHYELLFSQSKTPTIK